MLKLDKKYLELNIIPCIMLILSIMIALTSEENIRKVILLISTFLLGMQVQKAVYMIVQSNDKNK